MTTTERRLRGVPELLSVVAIVGIAWRLWPTPPSAPDEALRCGPPAAPLDCFVRISGGTFHRGAQATDPEAPGYDDAAQPTEGPVVEATVAPFWLQRTEATADSWRRCVRAGACREADVAPGTGAMVRPLSEPDEPHLDGFPVNRISWKGASDLCAFLGGRLPTEAEWELAARGPGGRRWPWGRAARCAVPSQQLGFPRIDENDGVVDGCDQAAPLRADAIPGETADGLIGLAGNLWEWTADAWSPTVGGPVPADGPTVARAQRGGSYLATSPFELRATVRGGVDPTLQLDDVGVRCAFGGRP